MDPIWIQSATPTIYPMAEIQNEMRKSVIFIPLIFLNILILQKYQSINVTYVSDSPF